MKEAWLLAALALCLAQPARAMDHRSQFGVGGALGATFPAPWTASEFRNAVGPQFPALSAWARYIPGTPEVGFELSYNYIGLSQMSFHAHSAVFSFVSRQNPWGSFHPFYGVGFGIAHSVNKFATGDAGVWDDPIVKLTAGIEFELNERTDLGFRLDHYSIFRDTNSQRDMHMLAPMLTLNYYFGKPAPLPTAPTAPAPVGTTVAPAPSTQPSVANPSQAPMAPKRKRAKKRVPPLRPAPDSY